MAIKHASSEIFFSHLQSGAAISEKYFPTILKSLWLQLELQNCFLKQAGGRARETGRRKKAEKGERTEKWIEHETVELRFEKREQSKRNQ